MPFSWKSPIFRNFGPLEAHQDIKYFPKLLDLLSPYQKASIGC